MKGNKIKINFVLEKIFLALLLFFFSISLYAQKCPSVDPMSDEYAMSHLEVDAGGLIGLVLPDRITTLPIKSYRWVPIEREKVSVVDKSETSATIKAEKSGTTVINFMYTYEVRGDKEPVMKDGKKVIINGVPQTKVKMVRKEGSYPFTIKINRLDAQTISTPSVIRIGWDETVNSDNFVTFTPKYSESDVQIKIDDTGVVERISGNRIKGMKLGSTTIHFSTPDGLESQSRIEVVIPNVKSVSINSKEKTLVIGDEMQLTYSFTPARSTPTFTWVSSNPDVIDVSENGLLKAKSAGKATITIISDNGVKDSVKLKVKKK